MNKLKMCFLYSLCVNSVSLWRVFAWDRPVDSVVLETTKPKKVRIYASFLVKIQHAKTHRLGVDWRYVIRARVVHWRSNSTMVLSSSSSPETSRRIRWIPLAVASAHIHTAEDIHFPNGRFASGSEPGKGRVAGPPARAVNKPATPLRYLASSAESNESGAHSRRDPPWVSL